MVGRIALFVGLFAGAVCTFCAAYAQPCPGTASNIASFMSRITGEWVGTCQQSTDGQQAENKYYHLVIKRVDENNFEGRFEYYRSDQQTGLPLHIGDSTVSISIYPNGTAKGKFAGQGTMMVNKVPKQQRNEFTETIVPSGDGLRGHGSGKISVSDMPLGLGKNGKINSSESDWSLNNGTFTIKERCTAGFRALVFTKVFKVVADSSARRGPDVASVMPKRGQVLTRSSHAGSKRS